MYIYHALINGLCVSLSWTVGAVLYCPLLCFGLFHFLAGAKPFFLFSISMWKDFHQNAEYWKQTHFRTRKYTVCRCVHVLFSLGILWAWAVKGLRSHSKNPTFQSVTCTACHPSIKTLFLIFTVLFSIADCFLSGSVVGLCLFCVVILCLLFVAVWSDCVFSLWHWSDYVCCVWYFGEIVFAVWQALWQRGQIVFAVRQALWQCGQIVFAVWQALWSDCVCCVTGTVVRLCLLCDRHCGQIVFAVWQALWSDCVCCVTGTVVRLCLLCDRHCGSVVRVNAAEAKWKVKFDNYSKDKYDKWWVCNLLVACRSFYLWCNWCGAEPVEQSLLLIF